jgi:hypothetical protein
MICWKRKEEKGSEHCINASMKKTNIKSAEVLSASSIIEAFSKQ